LKHGQNGLTVKGNEAGSIEMAVSLPAAAYNGLEVRMKVSAGKQCRLQWQGPVEPVFSQNAGVTVPIIADNAFHTYVLPLDPQILPLDPPQAMGWLGQIRGIRFTPSDAPCTATISRMAFTYVPEKNCPRVTLRYTACEALFGQPPAWNMTVPKGGVFEARVGMDERAWDAHQNPGARFTVNVVGIRVPGRSWSSRLWTRVRKTSGATGTRSTRI